MARSTGASLKDVLQLCEGFRGLSGKFSESFLEVLTGVGEVGCLVLADFIFNGS